MIINQGSIIAKCDQKVWGRLMEKHVYEITGIQNKDILVEKTDISDDILKEKARKLTEQPPCILGRKLGLIYWNYDSSITEMEGYTPQAAYPDIYEEGDRLYIVFDDIEDLTGDHPLNRFIWEDEAEPQRENDLHFIKLSDNSERVPNDED